jgi:DNA-binding NtrC family response regulator
MSEERLSPSGRLLLVEDDAALRKMLRRLMESYGMEVDEADNARDGIEMLKGDPEIGIVVLDLGLPPAPHDVTEGIGFLKQVFALARLSKVIVLSGLTQEQAILQSIEHGAFDFLRKPFDPMLLKFSLERAITWAKGHGAMLGQAKVPLYIVAEPATNETGAKQVREAAMEKLIQMVLADTHHNVSEAARRLGMSREHLYYYMGRYNIRRESD